MMQRFRNSILILAALTVTLPGIQEAHAEACRGRGWTPTFVHDLDHPDGPWFNLGSGRFERTILSASGSYVPHACDQIRAYGIRDYTGYTDCQHYTRIQCGCRRGYSETKPACAQFLRQHTSAQPPRPNTPGYR
jgi:hypothetical protein